MNIISKKILVFCVIIFICLPVLSHETKTLYDFGWSKAKTGSDRARIIYEAQTYAIEHDTYINYSGIGCVDIEITKDFKSIPLANYNDFGGIIFNVINNYDNVSLFEMKQTLIPIKIEKQDLDNYNFYNYKELCRGEVLLVIKDKNYWVDQRVGHSQGHVRKDVLLIKNGVSQNRVIASYNNNESEPECSYCTTDNKVKYIKNFTLNRMPESSQITYCANVNGQVHLVLENITLNTPESELYYDMVFRVNNSADVTFKDIIINGTYSQSNKYGYGFYLNNLWKTTFINVQGYGVWGVMGNNNMSDTYLKSCKLNRFDIHCYGRNVYIKDCVFNGGDRKWYCGGSSIFGKIRYEKCRFMNCTPIAYGDSYKTLVGADVIIKNCVFDVTEKCFSVFNTKLNTDINPRKSLSQKNLPNIEINGLQINIPEGIKDVYLYYIDNDSYTGAIGYINNIKIKRVALNYSDDEHPVNFILCNKLLNTENDISINVRSFKNKDSYIRLRMSANKQNKVLIKRSSFRASNDIFNNIEVKTKRCKIYQ